MGNFSKLIRARLLFNDYVQNSQDDSVINILRLKYEELNQALEDKEVEKQPERRLKFLNYLYQYSEFDTKFIDQAIGYATDAFKTANKLGKADEAALWRFRASYKIIALYPYKAEKEIEIMRQSLNKLEKANPKHPELIHCQLSFLMCLANNGIAHYYEAAEFARKLEKEYTNWSFSFPKDVFLGYIYCYEAIACFGIGEEEEALLAYKKYNSTDFSKNINATFLVYPYLSQSKVHATEAIKIAPQLLELSYVKDDSLQKQRILVYLSDAYANTGNYKSAYRTLNDATGLIDEHLKKNIEEEGQKWAKKFELQEKDYELAQMKSEKRLYWIVAFFVILLLAGASAMAVWYWRNARETKAKNRVLAQKIATIEQYRSEVSKLRTSARQRLDSKSATDKISDEELLTMMDEKTEEQLLYLKPKFTADDMCKLLNVSGPRLQLFFKQSPDYKRLEEYFDTKRMVRACAILQDQPGLTIQAVASDAGFPTVKTFNRKFKEAMGMTPSEYRRSTL